jgi:hypothetical protein
LSFPRDSLCTQRCCTVLFVASVQEGKLGDVSTWETISKKRSVLVSALHCAINTEPETSGLASLGLPSLSPPPAPEQLAKHWLQCQQGINTRCQTSSCSSHCHPGILSSLILSSSHRSCPLELDMYARSAFCALLVNLPLSCIVLDIPAQPSNRLDIPAQPSNRLDISDQFSN